MNRPYLALALLLAAAGITLGQQTPTSAPATASSPAPATATAPAAGRRGRGPTGPYAPATLPGKGLDEFNFMYAGETAPLNLFIVKNGKIDWQYTQPKPARGAGEISDASMLPNGNILFAYQFGAAIVAPDKKIVWSVEAPAPTEIHTATMVSPDKVAYIANGTPPKLHVVNITTNKEESSFELPVGNATTIHPQFRHVRMTPEGNFLVAHMDMGKVVEYDKDGKAGWSVAVPAPWAAVRLKNGNTLITSNSNFVREVNPKGDTVWEFRPATDAPGYRFSNTQTSVRLANGNTLISNWHGKDGPDVSQQPVQFVEVTPDKKIVWALRSWTDPANLGTSTNIQLLDTQQER